MYGMFSFLNDANNYEERKIGKEEVNGVEVSTAYTSDCGYETAILDANGVHPVERYETKKDAEIGHKKWIKKAMTIKTVTKLGWMGLCDEEEIVIVRET